MSTFLPGGDFALQIKDCLEMCWHLAQWHPDTGWVLEKSNNVALLTTAVMGPLWFWDIEVPLKDTQHLHLPELKSDCYFSTLTPASG